MGNIILLEYRDMKCIVLFLQCKLAISYVPRGIWAIYLTPVEKAMRVLDV